MLHNQEADKSLQCIEPYGPYGSNILTCRPIVCKLYVCVVVGGRKVDKEDDDP